MGRMVQKKGNIGLVRGSLDPVLSQAAQHGSPQLCSLSNADAELRGPIGATVALPEARKQTFPLAELKKCRGGVQLHWATNFFGVATS